MNVIHVIWGLAYGGAETLLVQLLNDQCKNNYITLIIINDAIENDLKEQLSEKITVYTLKRPLKSKNPIYLLKLSGLLLWLKSDIIHFHQDNLIEYVPVRFFKKNLCLTIHSVAMDTKSLYKYDHLFAISKAVQKKIKKNTGLNSILIYNGINTCGIKKKDTLRPHSSGKFHIVQIGRLIHSIKGQHLLIEAAAILMEKYQYTDFDISIIGDGDSKTYLQQLIVRLNLQGHIYLEGNKSPEFIKNNLCQYDLLAQPSIYEGFGLVAVEAMAAGVPVLASDVDGLVEITQHGMYGYCFEQNNIENLAESIWLIVNKQHDEIESMSEKAYQYVKNNFDITVTSQNYINTYQKILKK